MVAKTRPPHGPRDRRWQIGVRVRRPWEGWHPNVHSHLPVPTAPAQLRPISTEHLWGVSNSQLSPRC
jgi:hypothetical protein